MLNPFVDANRRIRNGWWLLIFWLVMAPIGFPILIALHEFNIEPSETARFTLSGAILLAAAVICQWLRKRPLRELGMTPSPGWWRELIKGGLIGALLMLLPSALLWLCSDLQWKLNPNGGTALFSGLLLMAAVAFAEETLYRGFMFQRLIDGLGVWPAQLLMAALFMVSHWNNPAMVGSAKVLASLNIFAASLLFGVAFIKTGRLAMPIGIHLMANWVQGPLLGFGVSGSDSPSLLQASHSAPTWLSGGEIGLEASVPGLLMVCVTLYWLHRHFRCHGSTDYACHGAGGGLSQKYGGLHVTNRVGLSSSELVLFSDRKMRPHIPLVASVFLVLAPSAKADNEFGVLADARYLDNTYKAQGVDKHALKLGEANDRDTDALLTLGLLWQYEWQDEWRFKLSGLADSLEDGEAGVIEAFVGYQPTPDGAGRSQLRTGFFFAPFSLENTERFWQDRYGLTPSALNSWLGEELRTLGMEYAWDYRGEVVEKPWRAGFSLAAFQGNDPAGSLLAWRGFGLHSRVSRWNEHIALPDLPAFTDAGPFPDQSNEVTPFVEVDNRIGWYAGLRYDYQRSSQIHFWHYDNRGEPTELKDGQYAWDTQFDLLSVRQIVGNDWELLLQWMQGTTFMGAEPTSVDVAFRAGYLMLSRRIQAHNVSLRFDQFSLDDRDGTVLDNNEETGHSLAIAWLWQLADHWRIGAEWLRVSADRPALATVGVPTQPDDHQVTFSLRFVY